jgi:hypothetical protein
MIQPITTLVVMIVLVYLMSFSLSLTQAQEQSQTLNKPENVNVTSSDKAVYEQANVTSDNQTILGTNVNNNTNTNGTKDGIFTNASQQSQAPLQSLGGLLPAPSQSLQQQHPSTLAQQQIPPLASPANLISPRSSPQQQNLLPLMQPSQQLAPPIMQPTQQLMQPSQQLAPPIMQPSQQPSIMIPPPSTSLYPVRSFPSTEFNYQPPVILSQYSYVNNIGSMHIVGEVLNQAPMTAEFVKIIATLYNANGQVIGTDFTYADPSDLAPGQRAPFDIILLEGSVPMYQMSGYGLTVDSQ